MVLSADIQAAIAANRDRYEVLKRAGQGHVPGALPPPSARGLAVDEAAVLHRETIPGGWYWSTALRRGEGAVVQHVQRAAERHALADARDLHAERAQPLGQPVRRGRAVHRGAEGQDHLRDATPL